MSDLNLQAMYLRDEIQLSAGQCSDKGRKERNEDCLGFVQPEGNLLTTKGAVAVIADGVSTAEAGGEAAEICVREFLSDYFDTPDIWTVGKSAQKVLTSINRTLYSRSHEYLSSARGYVCTLSLLVIKSRTAHLFHIGDSRIYLIRNDQLEALTEDHVTQLNKREGCLSRAMGMDTHLEIDYRPLEIQQGDLFLLTTDGVHDSLPPEELLRLASSSDELQRCAEALVDAAYRAGSRDNLSCQLVRVDRLHDASLDRLTEQLTALPFPPELEPGMKIDGYLIEEELYASSRSQLYRVQDLDSGERWVMKTPSRNFDDDAAYIERFIMEEWVGSRISNDHVVRVHIAHRPKTFLYYLMEPVEGMALDQWIKQNPAPRPAQAIELVQQIADGLKAFHQRETLHQDLKPSNIMITPDNRAVIVDFGSVFVAGINEIFVPLKRDRVLGTLNYSDPVFRLGQNTGIKGDMFSLAAITYELFTHHLPYGNGLENCDKPQQLQKLAYIPADRHNPIIPVWFDRALEKALAIDPAQRYDSLEQMMRDLTQPNPDLLVPREEAQKHPNALLFWQLMSLVWFMIALFTLIAFWLK
ncbi:bifunctional protein-serine/threonine kinase/phosphatase [Marinobacterium sp. D7]|uniref:bifunctional protein-serine/threonine kinase/phosphatase n=1 Tax=Marinobacterium ramblicola TaxID=2849041 RepID=UPI001C2DD35F|nr:bifunctional protein-serine/threonine kinase/phosphatase [Marinobacterium ramblicola]MBV1787513.1 bifunctional protein-serine/threonine kinase/phosphatase [Marinobacterium ramblicola]